MSLVPEDKPKRGGRGRGRVAGTPNKLTAAEKARIESELKSGNTMPLDYLLRVMRDPNARQSRRDWAAATAAPYLHPKLQAIAMGELNPPKPADPREKMDVVKFGRALALMLRQAAAGAQDATINSD